MILLVRTAVANIRIDAAVEPIDRFYSRLLAVLGLWGAFLGFGSRYPRQENRGRRSAQQAMYLTMVYDLADSSSLHSWKESHFTSTKRASHVRSTNLSICSIEFQSSPDFRLVYS